jgi:peroxisome-assembly ATPase
MTSSSYLCENSWTPLPQASRKWEGASKSANTTTHPTSTLKSKSMESEGGPTTDKYASVRSLLERPAPPRISQDHVWGVRDDWGKGAGTWGSGAQTFNSQTVGA